MYFKKHDYLADLRQILCIFEDFSSFCTQISLNKQKKLKKRNEGKTLPTKNTFLHGISGNQSVTKCK